MADPDELIAALQGWGTTGDGANPAVAIIDDAARRGWGWSLAGLAGELSSRRTGHVTRAGELEGEIGLLRQGGHDAPPAPHTRFAGVCGGLPAHRWRKVTDFAPGLIDGERAGLEAALEAAGILDAWVTPEGNLIDGDVIVASALAPVAGASCASLLVPAIDLADPQAGGTRNRASRIRSASDWTWARDRWRRRGTGHHGRAVVQRHAERRLA